MAYNYESFFGSSSHFWSVDVLYPSGCTLEQNVNGIIYKNSRNKFNLYFEFKLS